MARMKKQYEFYNTELKERFISQYSYNTQRTYRSNFSKIAELEHALGKDLYDFNLEEIQDTVIVCAPKTPKSADSVLSMIRKYIQFCINEGYTKSNIDFSLLIQSKDVRKLTTKTSYLTDYITSYAEYKTIVMSCLNAQDAATIIMAFNGIKGKELVEMRNLTMEDLHILENYVIINKENDKILIKLEPWEMETLVDAHKEEQYIKHTKEGYTKCNIRYLADTKYILKPTVNKRTRDNRISIQAINQRMDRVGQEFNKPYLSVQNIWVSGLMLRIHENFHNEEKLKEIFRQYDLDDVEQRRYYKNVLYEEFKKVALTK